MKIKLTKFFLGHNGKGAYHCEREVEMTHPPVAGWLLYGISRYPLFDMRIREVFWTPASVNFIGETIPDQLSVLLWHEEPYRNQQTLPDDLGPNWKVTWCEWPETIRKELLEKTRKGQ